MKKTLSLVLATLVTLATLVSCASNDATNTTPPPQGAPNDEQSTTTTTVNTPPIIIPGGDPETGGDGDEEEYVYDFPNATSGDIKLRAYEASGFGLYEGEVVSDSEHYMGIFTNDSMTSGKLTATFTSIPGDADKNDNGIVFAMADYEEGTLFWEDGPSYYMLFVSDRGSLYLSKVAYQGQAWTVCKDTADPIPNYVHGQKVTITAEWDGAGNIKCYANNELLIEYTDNAPLSGTHYGVRCEGKGVIYHSVVAEHN